MTPQTLSQHTFYNSIGHNYVITKLLATRNQRIDSIDVRTPYSMPVLILVNDVAVAVYNCSRYHRPNILEESTKLLDKILLQSGDILEIRAPDQSAGMCLGTIDYTVLGG